MSFKSDEFHHLEMVVYGGIHNCQKHVSYFYTPIHATGVRLTTWFNWFKSSICNCQQFLASRKAKGQVISSDFIMASVIFLVLFGMLFAAFTWITDYSVYNEHRKGMEMKASQTLEMLVRTKGYPSDWEENPQDAIFIGLASSDRTLDERKLNAFLGMDYNTLKDKLVTGEYDFQFRLVQNGSSSGQEPSGSIVAYNSRIVLLRNSAEKIEMMIWRS